MEYDKRDIAVVQDETTQPDPGGLPRRSVDRHDLVGPGEAARRLGVTPRTVQRWLRQGRLPAVRVGQRLRVPVEALVAAPGGRVIRRLLVANRGELVVRIARTCRRLGITCLALVTDDQRAAWWATQADEAVPLPTSYLDGPAVIAAARAARVDAIHPGYGFLAEQADFAAAVEAAGLTWVGPPPDAMRALGDKAAARRLAASLGLPVLAGYDDADQSDRALARAARRIGHPLLIKPAAGGGGMGMHVAADAASLPAALARARREARAAFGDDRLVLERYLAHPRHVEVQLLGDAHGAVIHLGERDCSLQRRHQKVIEEAPAPGLAPALRQQLGEAAVTLARAAGYRGAGTVEFLLDDDGAFTFMELNARLQVEHPVTEAVTGLDLVEAQLRVAAGEPLWLRQADVRPHGHAIEARLYAEDPWAGFLPATGRLEVVTWPADPEVRVDAGVGAGDRIETRYDPLLAKLVARGPTRAVALDRLAAALAATHLLGVTTNRGFLQAALRWPEVRRGRVRTDTLERRWTPSLTDDPPEAAWPIAAAALAAATAAPGPTEGPTPDSTGVPPAGFRLNAVPRLRVAIGVTTRSVPVEATAARPDEVARRAGGSVVLDLDGRAIEARVAPPPTVADALRHAAPATGGEVLRAPLPGVVRAVRVAVGQVVEAGQVLLVLEAMKMEHAVVADVAGTVTDLHVAAGQTVQRGDPLAVVA